MVSSSFEAGNKKEGRYNIWANWRYSWKVSDQWLTIGERWLIKEGMIGRLTGALVQKDAEGGILLDVHGVGFELTVPRGTLERLGLEQEDRVTLFVHTHVREDALVLFGFSSAEERQAFRVLLGVTSIGPRLALSVLSVLPAAELAKAIRDKDVRSLVAVPGVGKKSAERLILELQDKLGFVTVASAAMGGKKVPMGEESVRQQVVDGLTRLGFKPSEAEWAVSSLGKSVEDRSIPAVIREALALLRH